MKTGTLISYLMAGLFLIQACVSSTGRPRVAKSRAAIDPFSVEGMTEAVLEIEKALGTERISALREKYKAAFRSDPKHPFKRFLWAYSLDDRNEAWTELTKVTKLNDRFYWAHLGMALILNNWKVYDQAEMSFRRALKLGPRIAIGYGRFGKMHLKKDNWEAALPLLRKAVKADPSRVAYREDLARALELAGKTQAALDTYRKALELEPKRFHTLAKYANLLSHSGDKAAAVEAYQAAAQSNPDAYGVRYRQANLLVELGNKEKALVAFQQACQRKPTEIDCWRSSARLAGKLGKKNEQTAAFERLLQIDRDDFEANKFLGPVYLKAGEIEKALPAYLSLLEKEKDNLDVLLGLAAIYEQGGEYSKAIEFNQKILGLSSDHAQAREALNRLFGQFHILIEPIQGKRPDEVFARNRQQIAKVYQMILDEKPRLSGEMHLKVTVNDQGGVDQVTVVKNTVGHVAIDLSAVWNLRRSKFPKGFGATYDFELSLKPGD